MAEKKTTKKTTRKNPTKLSETNVSEVSADNSKEKKSLKSYLPTRTILFVLGLIIVGGLVFLASKFMVVAWVDKQPITRFEYLAALDKKFGKEFKDQLIVEKLLLSEGAKKGVAITSDEIGQEIKKIETEQGGSEQLAQIMEAQGISKGELNKLVKLQLLRQKLFGESINITDAEVKKYLDENKEQFPASASAEQITQIKESLKQQKMSTGFNNWIKENLQSNRVVRI